jgi:hypothetical protein
LYRFSVNTLISAKSRASSVCKQGFSLFEHLVRIGVEIAPLEAGKGQHVTQGLLQLLIVGLHLNDSAGDYAQTFQIRQRGLAGLIRQVKLFGEIMGGRHCDGSIIGGLCST